MSTSLIFGALPVMEGHWLFPDIASLAMPRDSVAKRLKIALARSDMGLRDHQVAEKANVLPSWLGAVKQGHIKQPASDKLAAVARVLGEDPIYLIEPMIAADVSGLGWTKEVLADALNYLRDLDEKQRGDESPPSSFARSRRAV